MKNCGMKLIYFYVYGNDIYNSVEINFSNNYFVTFENEEKSKIRIEKLVDEENYEKRLYSNYIENISVFVGANGIGKTSLLNYLGLQDADIQYYYKEVSYFAIYVMEEKLFFEGMEGEDKFRFFDEDYEKQGIRYWSRVSYDESKGKLSITYDQAMDFLFPHIRDEYDKIEFFYYKDNVSKGIEWTKELAEESGNGRDYNNYSLLRRNLIKNAIYDIYHFLNSEQNIVQLILKTFKKISGYLILNTENENRIQWEIFEEKDIVKSFIVQLLFNLCEAECKVRESEKLKEVRKLLIRDNNNELPKVSEYEFYRNKLIDIYIDGYDYNAQVFKQMIEAIERLGENYFKRHKNIWKRGIISAEIIEFCVNDDYDQNLYNALVFISTFNEKLISYSIFDYKYDYMSAGEIKCIDIFSGVFESINKNGKNIENKNLVLLLDEPDKGLHPELSRRFISILNSFSEELGKQYNCTFQYIITTHSPFLILDVPKSYIYMFHKGQESIESKIVIQKGNIGIMSNIADLIKDTFFLESPFGVLSEKFFKNIQKDILNLKEGYSQEAIYDIKKRIEVINEMALKTYLISRLENQLESICTKNELLQYYKSRIEEITKND